MKKLFAFILGGAFTASFAFADVSIGISGRGAARVFDFSGYNNDYDNEAAKTAGVFGKDGSHSSPATVFGELNFLTILISALQQRTACLE